ncbi:hypothetical protein PHYBOEH_008460 [Phytophthora boehmeriae]|uniref:Uncharacterized protein n=1 Tax=Phytophthora boehmeriae TaxID=109152 RepID=A0A8T1W2Q5_9STRA|nr:hypothetical protein PHYBOEH_008460 [Phytophthora boehmeriae]
MSFLRRLLHHCIRLEEEIEYGSGKTGQDTVDMQTEIEELRREWAAMRLYYEKKLDQQAVIDGLKKEISRLDGELSIAQFQNEVLKNQLRSKTVSKWLLTDYSEKDPTITLTGNFLQLNEMVENSLHSKPMAANTQTINRV